MIKMEELILLGKSCLLFERLDVEFLLNFFGEPEILTPARKSYPMILVYSDLELRFREEKLTTLTVVFKGNETQLPAQIDLEQFSIDANREFTAVEALLKRNHVTWKKDEIMSDLEQVVYVTEHNVHLAFYKGLLTKIGVVY
jgi:hypothetical protein